MKRDVSRRIGGGGLGRTADYWMPSLVGGRSRRKTAFRGKSASRSSRNTLSRVKGGNAINAISPLMMAISDHRIKRDIVPLNETHGVDKLKPVTYYNTVSKKHEIGLIANEVQNVYPSLVHGEKDGAGLQSVNYMGLIPILINEVKNLKKRMTRKRVIE